MKEISAKTGVRIEATSQVYDLLPWGDQTTISAQIDNQTLRVALEAMTRKLGLTFVLKDNFVELRPMPALVRNELPCTVTSRATARPSTAANPKQLHSGRRRALESLLGRMRVLRGSW